MKKDTINKTEDPEIVYADIINLPNHRSDRHAHMSLYDRAAQFAPFAALTGYDDMIGEEARLVDNKIELDGESLTALNQKLAMISELISDGQKPLVSITYFLPDPLKQGGHYETLTETIRRVESAEHRIVLEKRTERSGMFVTIAIEDILDLDIQS